MHSLCPPALHCVSALNHTWQQLQPARCDLTWIGCGGLAVAVVFCGSDFKPQPAFVEWAHNLQDGRVANSMVWLSENLCIFSNGMEGIVRQIKHNMRGHAVYLLGEGHPRARWYYFPVLLVIKLSVVLLLAPLLITMAGNVRSLLNWACLTALALIAFSITFRVQIGIRLVLPLVGIGIVGLSAALVDAVRMPRWQWSRPALATVCVCGLLWTATASFRVWPHGLCYVNELWGGTAHGYEVVSDSNYDWGQGLPELLAWREKNKAELDVWYFGRDPDNMKAPLREVPLHVLKVDNPDDLMNHVQRRYFAVSTTLLYGQVTTLDGHRNAATFLRQCPTVARTTTFLIYERQALSDACHRVTQHPPAPARTAN